MLCLEGLLNQEKGQIDAAARDVVDGLKLSGSLQNEPTLISQLVRIAGQTMCVNSLERLLSNHRLQASQLEALMPALRAAETQTSLTRTWAGERCLYLPFFNAPVAEQMKVVADMQLDSLGNDPASFLKNEYAKELINVDFLFYLESFGACVEASQKPYPQRLDESKTIGDRTERAKYLKLVMSQIILPAFLKEALNLVTLRLALMALTVEQYRLTHAGKLPESMAAAMPGRQAVPEDPFDGQPLRFKIRAVGYVVYSVGEDGQDDGGASRQPDAQSNQGSDITLTVER